MFFRSKWKIAQFSETTSDMDQNLSCIQKQLSKISERSRIVNQLLAKFIVGYSFTMLLLCIIYFFISKHAPFITQMIDYRLSRIEGRQFLPYLIFFSSIFPVIILIVLIISIDKIYTKYLYHANITKFKDIRLIGSWIQIAHASSCSDSALPYVILRELLPNLNWENKNLLNLDDRRCMYIGKASLLWTSRMSDTDLTIKILKVIGRIGDQVAYDNIVEFVDDTKNVLYQQLAYECLITMSARLMPIRNGGQILLRASAPPILANTTLLRPASDTCNNVEHYVTQLLRPLTPELHNTENALESNTHTVSYVTRPNMQQELIKESILNVDPAS